MERGMRLKRPKQLQLAAHEARELLSRFQLRAHSCGETCQGMLARALLDRRGHEISIVMAGIAGVIHDDRLDVIREVLRRAKQRALYAKSSGEAKLLARRMRQAWQMAVRAGNGATQKGRAGRSAKRPAEVAARALPATRIAKAPLRWPQGYPAWPAGQTVDVGRPLSISLPCGVKAPDQGRATATVVALEVEAQGRLSLMQLLARRHNRSRLPALEAECERAGERLQMALQRCGGAAVMRRYEHGIHGLAGLSVEAIQRRMFTRALPTVTTVRSMRLVRLWRTGEWYVEALDELDVAMAMGQNAATGTPLGRALAEVTTADAWALLGQGVRGGDARAIWAEALRRGGVQSTAEVRVVVANAGMDTFMAAVKCKRVTYVAAAESNRTCLRAHAAAWGRSGVKVFVDAHKEETAKAMAALGKATVFQYSPRCAPFSQAFRGGAARRAAAVTAALRETMETLRYVRIALPKVLIIENVRMGGTVRGRYEATLRQGCGGRYSWVVARCSVAAGGELTSRERDWYIGTLGE